MRPCADEVVYFMELFGLGSALDNAAPRGVRARSAAGRLKVEDQKLKGPSTAVNKFALLRQAMELGWRRAALGTRLDESIRQGSTANGETLQRTAGDGTTVERTQVRRDEVVRVTAPPTPYEVLTASSIRMMLSMASAFRKSNTAVLQAMCGTMLELMLETPPLVLAPLHHMPSSIEASTFGRVGDFCADLIGSLNSAEREAALGLYLALAVSRGEVSGLLKVVSHLLEVCRQLSHAAGESASAAGVPPLALAEADPPIFAGAAKLERGRVSEHESKVSAVLDRLANHRVNLRLSYPDECEETSITIEVPVGEEDDSIDWNYLPTVTSDGEFLYAWHPDIGLLKVGTGLWGTAKGYLYAQNPTAGQLNVAGGNSRQREGFIAVIGDTVYLQPGDCMAPYRFIVARTADLIVKGTVDAASLAAISVPALAPLLTATTGARATSRAHPCPPGDGESIAEGVKHEEKLLPAKVEVLGELTSLAPCTPLCCDGRLLYAVVPSETTGGPSIVAVDIANTGRVGSSAVELQRQKLTEEVTGDVSTADQCNRLSPPSIGAAAKSVHPENSTLGAAGGGEELDGSIDQGEWPWWQKGMGAIPGVRAYCNGDYLVVCWRNSARESPALQETTWTWRGRVAREEAESGNGASHQNSVRSGTDSEFKRVTHMSRFRLSTGACKPVEDTVALSGSFRPTQPCLGFDPSGNVIMSCSLRRVQPSASSPGKENRAELCVSLWKNCGLVPGPLADGPLGWRGILRTLTVGHQTRLNDRMTTDGAQDPEKAQLGYYSGLSSGIDALSTAAGFVLAHLDRLGAHYLGRGEKGYNEEKTGGGSVKSKADGLSVPFCYDLSQETFIYLVGLVKVYARPLKTAIFSAGKEEGRTKDKQVLLGLYVLCASLRLLNVNVGILLKRGLGVEEFGGEALRQSLLQCLLGLVKEHRHDHQQKIIQPRENETPAHGSFGRQKAAREALRLVVDGMDLFYPSERHQACLLSSYIQVYRAGDGSDPPPAAHALTLELLERASSLGFLRSLDATGGGDSGASIFSAEAECSEPGLTSYDASLVPTVDLLFKALLKLSTMQSVRNVEGAYVVGQTSANETAKSSSSWRADHSNGARGQVELAVLGALKAVVNLRCAEAFQVARKEAKGDGECTVAKEKSRSLLELFLLVLRAADNVLAAATVAQRPTRAASGLPPVVADALRNGLIGTLLPSCAVSALALLDKGVMFPSEIDPTDPLYDSLQEAFVQVTRKLGRLALPSCECGRVEEGYDGENGRLAVETRVIHRLGQESGTPLNERHDSQTGVASIAKHHFEVTLHNHTAHGVVGDSLCYDETAERGFGHV